MKIDDKTTRARSPSAPIHSLEKALSEAQEIYKKYSHNDFLPVEIASALEVSFNSGNFREKILALKEFGLIEKTSKGFKVSNLFHILNLGDKESNEFKRAALDSINKVDIFAKLLSFFPTKMPDLKVLSQRLEVVMMFNAARAQKVAGVFCSSLKFSGVLDSRDNILPLKVDNLDINGSKEVELPVNSDESLVGGNALSPFSNLPVQQETPANLCRAEIPLSSGRIAIAFYPNDLTSQEAARMAKVLAALVVE